MFNNQFYSECRTWDDSPEPGKRKIGVIGAFCHVVFLFISMFLLSSDSIEYDEKQQELQL